MLFLKKDEMRTWGSSVKSGGGDDGGLVGYVELTAVMSGRKQGFRNAPLSPLCLII